jgi:hypothetical protein
MVWSPSFELGLIADKFDQTLGVWQHLSSLEPTGMGPRPAGECKRWRIKPLHSWWFAVNRAKLTGPQKILAVREALGLGIGESSSKRRGSVMGPTRRFCGPTRWNWREIIVCERVECCLGWDMQG